MKSEEIQNIDNIDLTNKNKILKLLDKKQHVKNDIFKINDSGNQIYVIVINDKLIAYLYLIPLTEEQLKLF